MIVYVWLKIEYSFIRGMTLGFLREGWVWLEIQKDTIEYIMGDT